MGGRPYLLFRAKEIDIENKDMTIALTAAATEDNKTQERAKKNCRGDKANGVSGGCNGRR